MLSWLGRRIAGHFLKGSLDFDQKAFDAHIERLGKELTR